MGSPASDTPHNALRIFLSYARPDAVRAHALADALVVRGFAVWCDRQLEGGAAFAAEIEAELAAADAVVVAWSAASARSDWVLDEAAIGRDKGRLVPVRLDATAPPIGFRQYQALDLSAWDGASGDPALDRLARALHKLADGPAEVPHAASPALAPPRRRTLARTMGVAAVAALIGVAAWHPWTRPAAVTPPTIAVLPFADMSHTPDGGAFAEGVAEEILDVLARDPQLRVLGRTSAAMLAAHAGDPRAIERDLGVTHLLEGSVRSAPGRVKVDVRLIKLPGEQSILADAFDRRVDDIFAVQDEIGHAVAAKLGGALDRSTPAAKALQTTPAVYTRYLAARQLARTRQPAELERARVLLGEAIAADPNYAPAFASLAEVSVLLAADQYGRTPVPRAVADARGYAARAAALAPDLSQSRASLGMVAIEAGDGTRAIAEFRRAVALDPHRVETLNWLGYALSQNGDLTEAAGVMRQAVALEPLWFRPRVTAMFTLQRIGATDEIARLAASFVAIAPDRLAADRVAMAAALRTGANAQAALLARRVDAASPGDPQAAETLAAIGVNLFRFDLALKASGDPGSVMAAVLRGDPDTAIARARAAGPALWASSGEAYYAATAYTARARWADLVALYDARYGSPEAWLGQTLDPNVLDLTPSLALALEKVGRSADARRVRALALSRLRLVESRGLAPAQSAWVWAALLAADGDRTGAVARLVPVAFSRDPAIVCGGPTPLDRSPELAGLAAEPRFRAVVARCATWAATERAGLTRAGI